LIDIRTDHTCELNYYDRKRVHNLKYFTWIEQQGASLDELNAQWYDHEKYFNEIQQMTPKIDQAIKEFNNLL